MKRVSSYQEKPTAVKLTERQSTELDKLSALFTASKSDLIREAVQYWLNEQHRAYGDKLNQQELEPCNTSTSIS